MNDRALTVIHKGELVAAEPARFDPNPEQQEMIRVAYAMGATKDEFEVLLEISRARNLNPFLRQVHYVKRYDSKQKREVWAVQISIDGLRSIAERTRQYDGQDEPEFEYNDKKEVVLARVKVYKKGISRPFVGVARWDEYVQKTREGAPTKFWADMPFTMLGKCAEALAIRKAFPEDSGGLYVPEEMAQSEQSRQMTNSHSPHDDGSAPPEGDASLFDPLYEALQTVENSLAGCDTYDKALELRDILGTSAKQSRLTKDIQSVTAELSVEQRKELSRLWARCNRQVAKLEKELAPSAEDLAHGEPAEDFDR